MPKGKARKFNPGIYAESRKPLQPSMAPQAAAHRRGGTHKVRDADKTNSIYDEWNYKYLLDSAKERGVYRKDMKKGEMAKALIEHDDEQKRADRNANMEREKRNREEKKAKQRKDAQRQAELKAKHERILWKERKRARGESVSDDSMDEAELQAEHDRLNGLDEYAGEKVGKALSDESWDSTSTESSVRSVSQSIVADCRLRLFEWPYTHMPLSHPPSLESLLPEQLPWKVPYVPLKVITTSSKQKLFFPGQKYPPGIDPDYVPVLPPQTRLAARNGVLQGVLRKAIIERATEWAERTHVQGWNGRMYFELPPRNVNKDLAETYDKWLLENRRLLRIKGRGDGVAADRKRRHAQRHRNRGKRIVEVFEASQYRPLAVCYIPAYLDYEFDPWNDDSVIHVKQSRTLDNLFFIRFPGCEVPHYHFWAKDGQWPNPAIPNPAWNLANIITTVSSPSANTRKQGDIRQTKPTHPRKTSTSVGNGQVRAKKLQERANTSSGLTDPTKSLARVEHELYTRGLAPTLCNYRDKWSANGKQHAWKTFARALPMLYPSGQMPDAPPVEARPGTTVAGKISLIDDLEEHESTPLSPLRGDEAWTRDDAFRDVMEIESPKHILNDECQKLAIGGHEDLKALYRRSSLAFRKPSNDVAEWLDQLSPSHIAKEVDLEVSEDWEENSRSLNLKQGPSECPFCTEDWSWMRTAEQTRHMLSHKLDNNESALQSSYDIFVLPHRLLTLQSTNILFPQLIEKNSRTMNDSAIDSSRRRKRSTSSVDNLEFLESYADKKRKNRYNQPQNRVDSPLDAPWQWHQDVDILPQPRRKSSLRTQTRSKNVCCTLM